MIQKCIYNENTNDVNGKVYFFLLQVVKIKFKALVEITAESHIIVTQGFEIMPMSSSEDLSEELVGARRSSEELGGTRRSSKELGGARRSSEDHGGR